jgi:transcription elongation GreA/GreB family factor
MSRAFVREVDTDPMDVLPERAVSRHPNLVTEAGLGKIDEQLRDLDAARAASADDAGALARIERDSRYWRQRRATARVIQPPASPSVVRFGVRVRLRFQDGTERSYQIVGEDEADPPSGLVSWTSPVATSLIGRLLGDSVELFGQRATIVELRP